MPGYTGSHYLRFPLGTERPKALDIKNLADDVDSRLTTERIRNAAGHAYLRQNTAVACNVNASTPGYYALPLTIVRNNAGITLDNRAIVLPQGEYIVTAVVRWSTIQSTGWRRLIISDTTGTAHTTWAAFTPLPGAWLDEGFGLYGVVGEQRAAAAFTAPAGGGRLMVGVAAEVATSAAVASNHPGIHIARIGTA